MITRRALVASAVAGLASAPWAARAQKPRPLRLGYLGSAYRRDLRINEGFFDGLREQGFVEGDNLVVMVRDIEGRPERYAALAAELVALAPDVIVAPSPPAARAARQATSTIPIVFIGDPDPVASGLVATLARPGGNVTGISNIGHETFGKRMEILKQAVPTVRRAAYLWQRGNFPERAEAEVLKRTEAEARVVGVRLVYVETSGSADLERAFGDIGAARVDAVVVSNPHPVLYRASKQIAALAIAQRLPTIGHLRDLAEDGFLLSYGPNFVATFRRAATYVSRIARGAKPADLAVERATTLELLVNLRTASAIGVTIPPPLLARADDILR